MSTTQALLAAAAIIGICMTVGLVGFGYFAFRLVRMTLVLKASTTAKEAAMLLRADDAKSAAASAQLNKNPMELPDIGIHQMGESHEAKKNLRKKQNATSETY